MGEGVRGGSVGQLGGGGDSVELGGKYMMIQQVTEQSMSEHSIGREGVGCDNMGVGRRGERSDGGRGGNGAQTQKTTQ